MTVHFIGAGPGAADLITVRGRRLIEASPVCLYAGSLVPAELLAWCPPGTRLVDTARLALDEIVAELSAAHAAGHDVSRLHSGDPSVFSAVAEQMRRLDAAGIPYDITPGVPAFAAAAAALGREFTVPGVAQTVILTRTAERATAMPPGEDLATLGASRSTMVLHLAVQRIAAVVAELVPSYGADCPVAVVACASRPDELILRGTLADIAAQVEQAGVKRTAVIVVGAALTATQFPDSHLYSADRYRPEPGEILRPDSPAIPPKTRLVSQPETPGDQLETAATIAQPARTATIVQPEIVAASRTDVSADGGVGTTGGIGNLDERLGTMPARVLILGGTTEARRLAATLTADSARFTTISSLAGRTGSPLPIAGEVRIGGFGGAEGLAGYLRAERIDVVVDATHPFAAAISRNAVAATALAKVPLLALRRPGWTPVPGDRWHRVPDLAAAAGLIPELGSRIFLTTGRQDIAEFAALDSCWFLARSVEPPAPPRPRNIQVVLDRGPFTVDGELALLRDHRIDVLVTKDSGGAAAKLAAARELNVPVVIVDRPPAPDAQTAETVDEAVRRLLSLALA